MIALACIPDRVNCASTSDMDRQQIGVASVQVGDSQVVVDCKTGEVRCSEAALKARVETAVRRLMQALEPASLHAL